MKSILIILVVGLAFAYACTRTVANQNDAITENDILIYPGAIIDTGSNYAQISRIVSSPIVVAWCSDIIQNPHLDKDFTLSKIPLQNHSRSSQMDTIFSYVNNKSNVNIYRMLRRPRLMQTIIYESNILLSGRIHVGATRDVVIDVLQREFGNDTLTVISQDIESYFELYFDDDVLSGIYYSGFRY